MIRVRAVRERNTKNAAEDKRDKNLFVDKLRIWSIMIKDEKALKRRVSWERTCRERGLLAVSLLVWNHPKTTSERLRTSPVIPLPS